MSSPHLEGPHVPDTTLGAGRIVCACRSFIEVGLFIRSSPSNDDHSPPAECQNGALGKQWCIGLQVMGGAKVCQQIVSRNSRFVVRPRYMALKLGRFAS